MQTIEEEGKQLLRIMLFVACKLWCELVYRALEIPRGC
jgi:hypothetical protein